MRAALSLVAALVTMTLVATPALADEPVVSSTSTLCKKANRARTVAVSKHSDDAVGRDVCRKGVRTVTETARSRTVIVRRTTASERMAYLDAMRELAAPPPFSLAISLTTPRRPPAGTMSISYVPIGLAACIVAHESGGNPLASNGQYLGSAQWSPEAWARHGGHRFAPTPHGATYEQQLLVLSDGLRIWGCRDWCPFDGC